MAAPLDASDPNIASSIKEILAGTVNWIIFSYVPKINTLKLKVDEKGTDPYSDLVEEKINEGKVQFFYVRFQVVNMPKYAYIAYCGENVTGLQRGAFNSHVYEVANMFKKNQAPVHVQINARNEADFDEKKLMTQLTKAMGSNYDAGAKNQGLGGGVTNTKEGVTLHRSAQEEASKNNASRNLPTLPANRDSFWKEQNQDSNQPKQQAKGPVINPDERNKFWSATNTSAPPASSQPAAKGVAIDESERQKFWEQQKQAEEERKTQKTGGVVETPASAPASSLKSRFEQVSKPAEPAKPAPTGKKWTPPPAAAKPAEPAKPLTSGPPKTSAPPPTPSAGPPVPSGGPPKFGAPAPPSAGPPVPPKEEPAYSPPLPSGGPPKFGAPPPPAGGPPKSTPPAFSPPPVAAYTPPPAEDNWDEPEPEPAAPAQPAWSPVPEPEPAPEPAQDWGTGYDAGNTGYDAGNTGYDAGNTGYDAGNTGYDAGNTGYDAGAGAEEGTVRALYTFTAEQPTDLNFNEGDYITVIDKSDPSGWWKGRDNAGNEGFFPSNFVEPI